MVASDNELNLVSEAETDNQNTMKLCERFGRGRGFSVWKQLRHAVTLRRYNTILQEQGTTIRHFHSTFVDLRLNSLSYIHHASDNLRAVNLLLLF